MPRVSTVKRLPPEIREEIHRLLESGQTLDSIVEHLRSMGVSEVSRSALGRYKQNFERIVERVRRSREIADALVRRFGNADESKSMRANIEMMHGIVSEMLMQIGDVEDGQDGGKAVLLEPKAAHDLAKALDHLARARKFDQEAIIKIRAEVAKEAEEKLDKAVTKAAGQAQRESLSPAQILERVKAIYRGEA
ncbi:hypothetical protein H4684_002289 [Desulfomicrobium macestii]|uniref:DUF3486 family protein n=1 Tax=Desulfomicrobium macestii TaxID=90731 RepID=A0ABR9H4I9_9BACT|nr:DUF3486 family protein [Desulfomicrobium macestii]MBE1425632.1 hypothetical protein [Desulfomicrobium macestii]